MPRARFSAASHSQDLPWALVAARADPRAVLLIAAIYAFVNLATARFVVDGNSMLPNFNTDQFIIVSRLSYIVGEPQRGDVVVFHYPLQSEAATSSSV